MERTGLCRPLSLGGLLIPGRLVLAPMAGVTDDVMRLLCGRYGAAFACTEMVSAKGMLMNAKSRELLSTRKGEGPVAAQIFGHEPGVMAQAVQYIEKNCPGIAMIDINMGCPALKIVRSGEGSALLADLKLAAKIMQAVVKAVRLPVSIKIRTGYGANTDVSREIAAIAMEAGICAVTVHGRTREQGYTGKADWEPVAAVKRTVGSRMAVIGNGDVKNSAEAEARMEQTGCDAVMIGRAAIGSPWVFSKELPDPAERLAVIKEHLSLEVEKYGEANAIAHMRTILAAYVHGMPGAAKARAVFFHSTKFAPVYRALEELFIGI